MPDPSPGPRRYVPVPGLLDIDAVEDANVADAFGEDDEPDAAPPPAPQPSAPPPAPVASAAPVPAPPTASPLPPGEGPGERPTSPPPAPLAEPASEAETAGRTAPPAGPAGEPPAPLAEPASEAEPAAGETDAGAPRPSAPPAGRTPALSPELVETAKTATRSHGRELVGLVVQYGKEHVPTPPEKAAVADAGPPKMVGRVGQLIPFLQVIPWLLAVVFAVSFWWDFDGLGVVLFGGTFALGGLLKVLSVSGLIGFGTNWLAITMLFQPREKRAIIPQGLIPAQRERVIYRLSEAISRELINADIIKQRIQESGVIGRYRDLALGVVRGVVEDPRFRSDLKGLARGYAQDVLGSESVRREVARLAVEKVEEQAGGGLGGVALRLYRTFAEDDFQKRIDRALDELPDAVAPLLDRIDTALDAVPAKVEARADEIELLATNAVLSFVEGFDVRTMISERARQFDEGQLEGLLKSTSNEQLNYIKYLGAILGVFGGFVIWQPLGALVVFVTLGLALWAIDEAMVRARRG